MNLFNNIEKFSYTEEEKKCVSLEEYIIFEDERNLEKYIVFKFRNNLLQDLHEIRFEVSQYDENKNLVERASLVYSDFSAQPEEMFVPKAKLKANYLCKTISVRLIYAKFDTAYFENDKLSSATFSFEKYNEQINHDKKKNMTKKEIRQLKKKQKEEEKKLKREKKIDEQFLKIEAKNEFLIKERKFKSKYLKHCFAIKNTSPRNSTPVANAILSIGLIAILGFSIWSSLSFRNVSAYYDEGDYSFLIYDNDKAGIAKYYGNKDNIIIPTTSKFKRNGDIFAPLFNQSPDDDYEYRSITRIENECFMNSNIKTISFQNPISIGNKAFYNCKNLNLVYGDEISSIGDYAFSGASFSNFESTKCNSIGEYAFENNSQLKSISVPNSFVSKNAFKDCNSLKSIYIGSTNATKIGELFGVQNNEIPDISDIYINQSEIPQGFFYDLDKNITNIHLASGTICEEDIYGENRRFDDNAINIEDNKIVSISKYVKRLHVPSYIKDTSPLVYDKEYEYLTSVIIDSDNFDYVKLLKNNPQIKELIFNISVDLPNDLLSSLSSLIRLEFNNGLILNGKNPLASQIDLEWLVISNVDNYSISSLFNSSYLHIHYLVIKNSKIRSNFFNEAEIDSLSLVDCSIEENAFNSSKVNNIYFSSSCNYENKVECLSSLSAQYVLLESSEEIENEEKYKFNIVKGIRLREYHFTFENFSFTANMYFFTYFSGKITTLFDDGNDYFEKDAILINSTGQSIYYYGDDVILIMK